MSDEHTSESAKQLLADTLRDVAKGHREATGTERMRAALAYRVLYPDESQSSEDVVHVQRIINGGGDALP